MTYAVRPADIAKDKQALLLLWKRNFENVNEKRYEWIYENNPSGPPKCLLLCHESTGDIVGALTLFPRNLYVRGTFVPAFVSGDMVVDRNHRSLGPVMKLVKSAIVDCEEKIPRFIYSFSTQNSEGVMLRVGFREIGRLTVMTRLLRTYSYIQRHIPFPILARALSSVLDLFARFQSWINCPKNLKCYKVTETLDFDQDFDRLWKTMKTSFGLVGERTSQYLNWRFNGSPYRKYKIFKLFSNAKSELAGYVVYSVIDNRAVIEDIGFLGDESSLKCLIAAFVEHQTSQKIDSIQISLCGNERWINLLKRNGFYLRSAQCKILVYPSFDGFESSILHSTSEGWFLTLADNDI